MRKKKPLLVVVPRRSFFSGVVVAPKVEESGANVSADNAELDSGNVSADNAELDSGSGEGLTKKEEVVDAKLEDGISENDEAGLQSEIQPLLLQRRQSGAGSLEVTDASLSDFDDLSLRDKIEIFRERRVADNLVDAYDRLTGNTDDLSFDELREIIENIGG